ncbi:hypothetical protein G7054_g6289 [Neopestalotiopsis clavispora]|nr:hypothetical protein G7054_g6289 [Neopestalotiopsis clavispora]
MKHKSPLFFCAPGCKDESNDAVRASFQMSSAGSATNSSTLWPPGQTLRVRTLKEDVSKVPEEIWLMIKAAAQSWLDGMETSLTLMFVSVNEPADIRISFRGNLPNWSCVGTRAVVYKPDQATMNFAFGGWEDKERKTVYTQAYIKRVAAHLFGHALGLPHAPNEWKAQWKDDRLDSLCGEFFAAVIKADKGDTMLRTPKSIMSFDRPALLTNEGSDERYGGETVDPTAQALLRKLYPRAHGFYVEKMTVRPGTDSQPQRHNTSFTSNYVIGLRRVDLDKDGDFSAGFFVEKSDPGKFLDVRLAWPEGLLANGGRVYSATYNILAFDQNDSTIQSGQTFGTYLNFKGIVDRPMHGISFTDSPLQAKRISFARPFDVKPQVLTFISGFCCIGGRWLRLDVSATDIDREGFTLNVRTWYDTVVKSFLVSWIAHRPADECIRSGMFPSVQRDTSVKDWRGSQVFDSPLSRRPRGVFCGFRCIDAPPNHNIRLEIEADDWDANQVKAHIYTWEEESRFVNLSGSYIAIL